MGALVDLVMTGRHIHPERTGGTFVRDGPPASTTIEARASIQFDFDEHAKAQRPGDAVAIGSAAWRASPRCLPLVNARTYGRALCFAERICLIDGRHREDVGSPDIEVERERLA
jgi:hypothetical protein